MNTYLMPAGSGEAEYVEKKSRFICRVRPAETEAEALDFLASVRKKHYDATHNVYAYILRENGIMRYSDDGEPGGTSGQPTLNVFRQESIENVICVVTRYFGGTLLGAGGLVRAYSAAAKLGLDAAGVQQMAEWRTGSIVCPYGQYERVRRLLETCEAVTEGTDFGAEVRFDVLLRDDRADGFAAALTEQTAGSIGCSFSGTCFRGVRIR